MSKNLPIFRRMIAVAHTARNCGRLAMTIEGEDEGSRASIDNLMPITKDTAHTTIEGYCVRDAKIRALMGWEYSHWMLIESAFICALVEEVSLVLDDFEMGSLMIDSLLGVNIHIRRYSAEGIGLDRDKIKSFAWLYLGSEYLDDFISYADYLLAMLEVRAKDAA